MRFNRLDRGGVGGDFLVAIMIVIRDRHTGEVMHSFPYENFDNASLRYLDFRDADMSHMVMSECDLTGADFRGADLRGAVFSNANISRALFSNADMVGVQIKWCNLDRAQFGNACLTVVGQ